ncbi:MAG: arylsulfatase [Cytophagales bacterium]|nr:arylsulfatase [Cytophagales bacterium]
MKKLNLFSASLLGVSTLFAQYDPVQPWNGKNGKILAESTPYKAEPAVKTPQNAPNVVWILLDDIGYGVISPFGGAVNTPNLQKLADEGLRYTNFHTTAICSPTRASLLSGRNQHSAHMGLFPETAIDFPGYDAKIPFEKALISEVLRENGYNTFAVGKWHLTPVNEATQAGPFNRWPTGRGFDKYFGFPYGQVSQWEPYLWEGTDVVEPDTKNPVHFTTLITNKAIKYISNQKSVNPDKPFFLYYTPGAGHAPHHVDKEWIEKYKGKFDNGWDVYRNETLERQKKLGIVPQNVQLPLKTPNVKPWDSLSVDEKKVYARFFEVYAGFVEHTDFEIGRLINHLKEIGQYENTIFAVVVGDNGCSKEGTANGVINGYIQNLPEKERIAELLKNIDNIGNINTHTNFPFGWASAGNTPFRYLKQDANAEGGTRNPLILSWPKGIKDKGTLRHQYSHVNSLWQTTVDLTGSKVPEYINGYKQEPTEGTSLAYTIDNPTAPGKHTVQYFEITGSRAIYKDGWKASVYHKQGAPFETDVWELYDLNTDFNERVNLASKNPAKLKELQDQFDTEAKKYNVYPLKDWSASSFGTNKNSAYVGRKQVVLYPGLSQTFGLAGPTFWNASFTIISDVEISNTNNEGVLFALGGRFGGLSLFIKDHKFQLAHNLGTKIFHVESSKTIPAGKVQLKYEFNFTATPKPRGSSVFALDPKEALEPAGNEILYINGEKVAESPIIRAHGYIFGYDEGLDIGQDNASPVSDKYKTPFAFTGSLKKVTIDFK